MVRVASVRETSGDLDCLPDESAHGDCDTEWWFVHGYYEGVRRGRRHFMTTIFRHKHQSSQANLASGFSLLVSVLDPAQSRQQAQSRIDPAAVELDLDAAARLQNVNLDRRLIEMYRSEYQANGPPATFTVDATPVELASGPFQLRWRDFSLAQSPAGFALAFSEPGSGACCSFDLVPTQPRLFVEGIGEPAMRPLAYATYPSLKLEGTTGGTRVRGHAWFDHQWGEAGAWLVSGSKRKRVVGWEWFGINLDDGSELLLIEHRDMKTRRGVARCAIVRRANQGAAVIGEYAARPVAYWLSPRTHVRYPIAWRIHIPKLRADLVFRPLVEDQELPVFGIARAIWEGAGTISGTLGGKPVSGRARLELHGYGYVFDTKAYFTSISNQIDGCIESAFPSRLADGEIKRFLGPPQWRHDAAAYNETIARPVWDLMARRGKQWRAIFNLLLLDALGVPSRRYFDLASVIPELCHTGSLIIDDIEDRSRIRRGDACIHLRYGIDVAINAANTIYFLPFLLLADHPGLDDVQRAEIYKLVFRAFVRAHFGQALDIHWSKRMSRSRVAQLRDGGFGDKILQMYADKTAAFIEAAAESACIVAGASGDTRAACLEFARTLGVAFQITDDVLNFSRSPQWGKVCGEDLQAGKTTYVIYRALQTLEPADQRELGRVLATQRARRDPAALKLGIELIRKSGVLDACRDEARAMADRAWSGLSRHLAPSEPKIMLRLFCASLLEIVYEA